jgi:hypothetical protein
VGGGSGGGVVVAVDDGAESRVGARAEEALTKQLVKVGWYLALLFRPVITPQCPYLDALLCCRVCVVRSMGCRDGMVLLDSM